MPDCSHADPESASPTAAAWQATLRLRFADDHGVTRLVERTHSGPLRVQKPLYPEGDRICHAIVVHPPGGVVGGDTLQIDVEAGAGAHALLTTPGAGKWYRANGKVSRQRVSLRGEYRQRYLFEVSWQPVWGGDYNALADRDVVAISAGVKF